MAEQLERILAHLLVPDNDVLLQATRELKEAFKNPNILQNLCYLLNASQNSQIRQYAAVLLRRKFVKPKQWKKLDEQTRTGVSRCILESLNKETERTVLKSIAQIVATIGKHELSNELWLEMLQIITRMITTKESLHRREDGLLMLSAIAPVAGEQLQPYMKSLLAVFATTLTDESSAMVPFYTIQCMTNLVSFVGTEDMNRFQQLIPHVMNVIKKFVQLSEERACEVMEIFDELIESEVSIIVPHIKSMVEMCLEIAACQNLGNSIRVKALSLISWLTKLKKKTIIKHKLVVPILDVLFPIMCQPSEEEEEECDENESSQDPSNNAAQVIDVMALHLPPEKLIPPLMRHVKEHLENNNPNHKKAAYIALAVIAEGASENIKNKYLESFLQLICTGITNTDPIVQNAAFFALGQYAEYMQPDISKFAPQLLPVFFDYLLAACQQLQSNKKDPPSLTKTFYALETFCENLDDKLIPYLPTLMERLMPFLNVESVHAKELAISCIGSVAHAAKEAMLPYFHQILEHLKVYLSQQNKEETVRLRLQALDTLGLFAKNLGAQNFLPMAHDCIMLGVTLLEQDDDPDLRRCTYGLFASVSSILKTDMERYMPTIIEKMLTSLASTEGIVTHYTDEENSPFPVFEDLGDDKDNEDDIELKNEDSDGEDDDDDVTGYTVENSYLEEKEDTCSALKDLSANVGTAFLPYLEKCYEEVKKLLDHPSPDVRKAAFSAITQFCITLHQVSCETGSEEQKQALRTALATLIPLLVDTSRKDNEILVVLTLLENLDELVKEVKNGVTENSFYVDSITMLVKDVFMHKLSCQDGDEEEEGANQQGEYEHMLEESAGEILPSLAKAMPPAQFAPYFAGFLSILMPKTKKTCSDADKSFAIGVLAEIVENLGNRGASPFVSHLLPIFLGGMKDDDEEVRNNAVFGLGVLVQNAGETIYPHYPIILQAVSNMMTGESNARVSDNICGAIARIIMANASGVPVAQALPAFLRYLPLKEDFQENTVVFQCLYQLFTMESAELFQSLPDVLRIVSLVIDTSQVNQETQSLLVQMVRGIHARFPTEFQGVLTSLSPESVETLKAVIVQS